MLQNNLRGNISTGIKDKGVANIRTGVKMTDYNILFHVLIPFGNKIKIETMNLYKNKGASFTIKQHRGSN